MKKNTAIPQGYNSQLWNKIKLPVLLFGIITLFISLADATMSYIAPVIMQNSLNNAFLMGSILSLSSIFGILTDLFVGERFKSKSYRFFIFWSFVLGISFPASFILFPDHIFFFILAMIIWGVYYELITFSSFHFIKSFARREDHAYAWGLLNTIQAVAYTFAPLIVSVFIGENANKILYLAAGFFATGFLVTLALTKIKKNNHAVRKEEINEGFKHEIRVWELLSTRVWYLLIFSFVVTVIDATFWSVGAILSNQENDNGLLFIAYGVPSLFMGFFAGRFGHSFGKKRTAFMSGIVSGVFLLISGTSSNLNVFLVLIFLSSVFTSLSWIEVLATFEDYVSRLGSNSNHMIGLQSSFVGLAYVVGPIVGGFCAQFVGSKETFSIMGILLISASISLLIVTPKKIKLPETKLMELEEERIME